MTTKIEIETRSPLEIPPSVLVYGRPGVGKSTEVARAFPRALYVQSSRSVLRPFASWLRIEAAKGQKRVDELVAAGIRVPDRITIQAGFDEKGNIQVGVWDAINRLLQWFADQCAKGTNHYDALVFDEWSAFAKSIYADMQKIVGTSWTGANTKIKEFHAWLGAYPQLRHVWRPLVLVCHDTPPKYHDDEKLKGSPKYGTLKYHGGPEMPIGSLIRPVCASMDVVLHMDIEDDSGGILGNSKEDEPLPRVFRTGVHPEWIRKIRDFIGRPVEHITPSHGLRELLLEAGFIV